MKRQGGFVLVELLVALALLAIITGIGVSSYSRQMAQGRDEADKTALASVSGALESFYADHGVYPEACDLATLGSYVRRWPLSQGEPMHSGSGIGEYEYAPTADLQDYDLTLHLRSGATYTLPLGVKPAPAPSSTP